MHKTWALLCDGFSNGLDMRYLQLQLSINFLQKTIYHFIMFYAFRNELLNCRH